MNSEYTELLDNEQQQPNVPALATLDMTEVFALVRAEKDRRELPRHTQDFGLHPLGTPVLAPTLSNLSTRPLALDLLPLHRSLPAHIPTLDSLGSQPSPITLRQIDRETYRVLLAPPHGAERPFEMDIPVGLPRLITVGTLKTMVGARPKDVAFRKSSDEERWTVCTDDYPVDLEDSTQVFKIREWAILS